MPFDLTEVAKAIGDTFKSISACFTASKKHQSETAILKENKRLKDSVNAAEKIFRMTDRCCPYCFCKKDSKLYQKLRNTFDSKD